MILAIDLKNKTKQISFQSWKWPEGFDDVQGQCDRTGDDYKKFMKQTGMGLEGTLEVTDSSLLFMWSLA